MPQPPKLSKLHGCLPLIKYRLSDCLQGEWSRLELMRDPQSFGRSAVRAFIANLPVRAHSIYFKDAIGNISTSTVKHGVQSMELILTPRYPLYGGWQAEFTLGYSVPLQVSNQGFRVRN